MPSLANRIYCWAREQGLRRSIQFRCNRDKFEITHQPIAAFDPAQRHPTKVHAAKTKPPRQLSQAETGPNGSAGCVNSVTGDVPCSR